MLPIVSKGSIHFQSSTLQKIHHTDMIYSKDGSFYSLTQGLGVSFKHGKAEIANSFII